MKYSKNFYQIKSNQDIFNKIVEEKASVGYYNLPYEPIEEILDYANRITKKHIVVVGIGGSSLGTRAIYEFLRPSNDHLKPLLFLDTIDPLEINYQVKQIDLQDSHFLFVSKSGNTIEVVSLLKYLHSLPIPQKVALDVEYLHHQSLWLDIKIIWLTFIKVIKKEGVSH